MQDQYDKRAVSLSGYGSLVPYHGALTYDQAKPGNSHFVPLPVEDESPEGVIETIESVVNNLKADPQKGRLFYTVQYSDYGFHSSGLEQLKEDLRNPFQLGEELKGTLESTYGDELEMHRPCFAILTSTQYGLFWLLLRGGISYRDTDDGEVSYFTKCGILMENPVVGWPELTELVGTDGPITQCETEVETGRVKTTETPLQKVYPVDQATSGDADIIAAENPFTASSVEGGDVFEDAVEGTQDLTFRVKGGTIGFEKENSFTAKSMTFFHAKEIHMWGHPLVICFPMCNAN